MSTRKSDTRFKDRSELLDFLLEITGTISSTLDLDTMLASLSQIVRQVVPFDLFAILLYNEKLGGLAVRYSIGFNEELIKSLVIPLDEGITGVSGSGRIPIVVGDVRSDPRYLPFLDAVRSEMAIPMVAGTRLVGVIDLQSTRLNAFTNEDSALIQLIASRVATSIMNARLYRRVERQNKTFKTLTNVAREFSYIIDLDELLGKVASTVRGLINYDAFSILLYDAATEALRHRFSIRYDEHVQADNIPIGKGVVGRVAQLRSPILVDDVREYEEYIELNPSTRSEMAVPLLVPDRLIGVMNLESSRLANFTQDHLQTLSLLSPLVAGAVESARLYEEINTGKAKLEDDLDAARTLQAALLPREDPGIGGLEIGIHFRPAQQISGDVFDFFEHSDDLAFILFGDVSGKSAAAALYGAMVTGLIRTLAPRRRSPAALLQALNESLMERKVEGRYLTLLVALWHPSTGSLTIANAAAIPPMISRKRQIITPEVEGFPLGLFAGRQYDEVTFQTEPDDVVLLFSDGIQDQTNPAGEEYGGHVAQLLKKLRKLPAQKIADDIFEDFDRFRGPQAIFDDQTIVVMKVKGKQESPKS